MTTRSFVFIVACLVATAVVGVGQSWFFGTHRNLVELVDEFIEGDRRVGGVQRNYSPHCVIGVCPKIAMRTTRSGTTGAADSVIRKAAASQGFTIEYAGDWYLAKRSDAQVRYRVLLGDENDAVIEWEATPSS